MQMIIADLNSRLLVNGLLTDGGYNSMTNVLYNSDIHNINAYRLNNNDNEKLLKKLIELNSINTYNLNTVILNTETYSSYSIVSGNFIFYVDDTPTTVGYFKNGINTLYNGINNLYLPRTRGGNNMESVGPVLYKLLTEYIRGCKLLTVNNLLLVSVPINTTDLMWDMCTNLYKLLYDVNTTVTEPRINLNQKFGNKCILSSNNNITFSFSVGFIVTKPKIEKLIIDIFYTTNKDSTMHVNHCDESYYFSDGVDTSSTLAKPNDIIKNTNNGIITITCTKLHI